jgi:flagellar biosynthesis/type III secretory pathway chaperone
MSAPQLELLRELKAAIDGETAALATLVEILRREQDGIIAGRPAELTAAVKDKMTACAALDTCRQRRHRAMDAARMPRDPVAAEARFAAHRALAAAWKALRNRAREASILNGLNARLVANRLQMVTDRLDALRKAHGRGPIYDPTGKTDELGKGRVIASA